MCSAKTMQQKKMQQNLPEREIPRTNSRKFCLNLALRLLKK